MIGGEGRRRFGFGRMPTGQRRTRNSNWTGRDLSPWRGGTKRAITSLVPSFLVGTDGAFLNLVSEKTLRSAPLPLIFRGAGSGLGRTPRESWKNPKAGAMRRRKKRNVESYFRTCIRGAGKFLGTAMFFVLCTLHLTHSPCHTALYTYRGIRLVSSVRCITHVKYRNY